MILKKFTEEKTLWKGLWGLILAGGGSFFPITVKVTS